MPTSALTHPHTKGGPRLTPGQRHLIVSAVLAGERQVDVAKRFGVHYNTVSLLCKSVRNTPNSPLNGDWRQRLTGELPTLSVQAIERSVTDVNDVHKAASTAIAHLKGIGALQGEGNSTITVMLNSVSSLPADLAQDYLEIEATTPPTSQDSDTLEP